MQNLKPGMIVSLVDYDRILWDTVDSSTIICRIPVKEAFLILSLRHPIHCRVKALFKNKVGYLHLPNDCKIIHQ